MPTPPLNLGRLALRLALGLGLLTGSLVGLGLLPAARALADDAAGADSVSVQVQTQALRRGTLPRQVSAFGTMQPEPAARQSTVAPTAAVVVQVFVRAGEAVRAGSALVSLTPTPETGVAYAQAVSALRVANESLQHTQRLLEGHLATTQQLAEAQKAVADARAALQALQSQGAGGPALLRAPFDALVMHVNANGNQWVAEGTALLELARPAGLVLEAAVPPAEAADITPGDAASVLPLGTNTRYAGRVLARGAVIDADSGLIPVRVALIGHPLALGQSARAIITVGTVTGYLVPHSAVLLDDMGESYVVQAVGGIAHVVHVRVLAEQNDQSAIDGPLDGRAPLVLDGNYQAEEGMHLRTASPAAAPAPTTAPATH